MDQLDNLVLLIARIIAAVIAIILTKYVIPILKEKYELHVNDKIKMIVKDAVEAAEQTIKGNGQGAVKKEEVLRLVIKFLDDQNVTIDGNILDTMIESAVFAMNNKLGE